MRPTSESLTESLLATSTLWALSPPWTMPYRAETHRIGGAQTMVIVSLFCMTRHAACRQCSNTHSNNYRTVCECGSTCDFMDSCRMTDKTLCYCRRILSNSTQVQFPGSWWGITSNKPPSSWLQVLHWLIPFNLQCFRPRRCTGHSIGDNKYSSSKLSWSLPNKRTCATELAREVWMMEKLNCNDEKYSQLRRYGPSGHRYSSSHVQKLVQNWQIL